MEEQIMRILIFTVMSVVFIGGLLAQRPNNEAQVRQAVQSFHAAFNSHDFGSAEEYTTEDWNQLIRLADGPLGEMRSSRN